MTLRPRLLPSVIFAASVLLAFKLADLWAGEGAIATAFAQTKADAAPAQGTTPAANPAPAPAPDANQTPAANSAPAANPTPPAVSAADPVAPPPGTAAAPPPPTPSKQARDPLQMSPEEIGELQQLAERRMELDKRAAQLSERDVLMQAAEKRIDEKIAKLQTIEKKIESDVKAKDDQEDARLQSLAHMYEQMKPTEAARILEQLDVPIIITMLSHMREMKAAPILATMDPSKAKSVTLALAEQHDPPAPPAPPAKSAE
jgi:flagellar motility protein MotE (MotC chaperone)